MSETVITSGKVKEAMISSGIETVEHHRCSYCHYMTRYIRQGEKLYFDSGCGCTGGRNIEPRDWQDAADWINMQSNPDSQLRLKQAFGLS